MQKNLHMSTVAAFIRRLHVFAAPLVTGALSLMLGACASYDYSGGASSRAMEQGAAAKTAAYAERPGLGTTLGHEYTDHSSATHFYRRSPSSPDAVGSFHYNDKEGAKAMSEMTGG